MYFRRQQKKTVESYTADVIYLHQLQYITSAESEEKVLWAMAALNVKMIFI